MNFQTRIQLPSGKTVSLNWLNDDKDRRNTILARIQNQGDHVLCRCRKEGLLIHIKRNGSNHFLARNPNSAALHHPHCTFYEPSPLVSGRFVDDLDKRQAPRYVAHQFWEAAGFNQWSSGMVDGEGKSKRSPGLALALISKLIDQAWTEREEGEWVTGRLDGERITIGVLTEGLISSAIRRHRVTDEATVKRLASGLAQVPISSVAVIPPFQKWGCVAGEGSEARVYTYLTNKDLLPVSNSWELSLIETLCQKHDTVIRPIWYLTDKRSFPSAIIIQEHRGTAIFIEDYHHRVSSQAFVSKFHLTELWMQR